MPWPSYWDSDVWRDFKVPSFGCDFRFDSRRGEKKVDDNFVLGSRTM